MAELFQRDRTTIQRPIKKIYEEGELKPDSTCAFFAQVQTEGKRQVERQIPIYNLDYDPRTETTQRFFKTVHNKMHFAAQ